jgi:hypothetical protein
MRALLLAAALLAGAAQAQFSVLPAPRVSGPPHASNATTEDAYKVDAARHLYSAYPQRIYKGVLPPFIYSVMVVQTEIDDEGQVRDIAVLRTPAADEVAPWVIAMVRRAGPYPAPSKLPGGARWVEIFLVDRGGKFQVDTLTEGQR